MKIRPAKISDAAALAKIHVSGWQNAYVGIIPADSLKKMSFKKSVQRFKKAIKDKTEETYVIEEKGVILGFSTIGKCRDTDMKNDTGEIWGIYIDPGEWRKGYGKSLAAYTEKLLENRGLMKITLWVLADNKAARKFYEHLGFKPEGKTKTLEKQGNTKAIRYIKKATPASRADFRIKTIKSASKIIIPMQKLCKSLGFAKWYNPEWKKGITYKLALTK